MEFLCLLNQLKEKNKNAETRYCEAGAQKLEMIKN